jgi:hypothetical protein
MSPLTDMFDANLARVCLSSTIVFIERSPGLKSAVCRRLVMRLFGVPFRTDRQVRSRLRMTRDIRVSVID